VNGPRSREKLASAIPDTSSPVETRATPIDCSPAKAAPAILIRRVVFFGFDIRHTVICSASAIEQVNLSPPNIQQAALHGGPLRI